MNWIIRNSVLFRRACGCLLICAGAFAAYWWFYNLVPTYHLSDPVWRGAHSARAHWAEEQKKYHRLSASPDLCSAGDMIGYYGDKRWCLWLIGKMFGGGNFRVCGCTETALMLMANQEAKSWKDWARTHRDETQEQWIRDGFAQRGVTVHLPPQPEDTVPLLTVLGHKTWNTLWGGIQGTNAPESLPNYCQYNAFRWLRDSGFDQTIFAVSNSAALTSDVVRVGLMQYTKWNAAYPKHDGVGILAFGKVLDDNSWGRPPLLTWWFRTTVWLLVVVPIVAGGVVLCWRRKGVGERVMSVACCVAFPFRTAGRWVRKHPRVAVYSGLVAGCIFGAITHLMLPAWHPDWVISHSTSPERVLRASHFAFNGHFEATPALKEILGDEFGNFLLRKLSAPDDSTKDAAACILAYSRDPSAEKALIKTYLQGQSDDLQLSLLLYLGWIGTDTSREFLLGILDHRIKGPRWSALRSLSMSSITGRYEIISQYLDDPDERVREQAADILKDRHEKSKK